MSTPNHPDVFAFIPENYKHVTYNDCLLPHGDIYCDEENDLFYLYVDGDETGLKKPYIQRFDRNDVRKVLRSQGREEEYDEYLKKGTW